MNRSIHSRQSAHRTEVNEKQTPDKIRKHEGALNGTELKWRRS